MAPVPLGALCVPGKQARSSAIVTNAFSGGCGERILPWSLANSLQVRWQHPVRGPNSPLCGERVGITQMGPGCTGFVELKSSICVVGACANYTG